MLKSIIIAVCFIAAIAIGVGLASPKYHAIKGLRADIVEKTFEFQSKAEYFSRVKETSQEMRKYEQDFSKISSAFPVDPSLPSLLDFFQRTSMETGLSLESISFAGTSVSEARGVKETRFNLSLVGSYHDFKVFISTVEKSIKIIEVENISFSFPAEPEDPFSFALEIRVLGY